MIITKTPFRISFFGGGTDFPDFYKLHGGKIISTTIDKYCYVTLRHLPHFFEYRNELVYNRIERVNNINSIEHPLIREAMRAMELRDLRIVYEGDLPARTGLGTSSSFAVGLLHAMHLYKGESVSIRQLADEAIRLERELCREDGGVQDQIAAAFGGLNRIDMGEQGYDVTPLEVSPERKRALQDSLMLFFTGQTHFSASLQTAHRKALSDKTSQLLQMKALADDAEAVLCGNGDLGDFGRLLHESWCLKRGITNMVSTDSIDSLYAAAREAGALGGKLLGAGGGGFLLFFVEPEKQAAVKAALGDLLSVPFSFDTKGTEVIFSKPV